MKRSGILAGVVAALASLGAVPQSAERPLKAVIIPQDSPTHHQAQLLGELDRRVSEKIEIGDLTMTLRPDANGKLEIDSKGDGKFWVLSKRDVVSVPLKGEGDKPKSLTAKIEFRRLPDGTYVYRNQTVLRVQVEAEQFVIVDANANGIYNEPGVDGMAWQNETWLYPLPGPAERWCSATMEFSGIEFGKLGEAPSVKGRPLATTVAAALPILKGVNGERVKLGLTPRPEDVKLSAELQKHCGYMAQNNILTHPEEKGKPGYSPEGHEAGMRSILSSGSPADSVAAGMVQTYFHRQDVIRPQTLAFGVGYEGRYGGIDGRSSVGKAPAQFWPVICPVPGQEGVGVRYGKEAPDACPGDTASGYPVTAYFGTPKVKLVSSSLKVVGPAAAPGAPPRPPAGETVTCYLYDPDQGASNEFSGYQHSVCIIAKDPLKPNTEYEVSLQVDVEGKPWSKTWRFSTGAGGREGFGRP